MNAPPILPPVPDMAAYMEAIADEPRWRPAMEAVCQRHGLSASTLTRCNTGSQPVYRVDDDKIIKFFAPLWPMEALRERTALGFVAGRLPVETPEILMEGELEGWPYMVLRRLEGIAIGEVEAQVDLAAWAGIMGAVGEAMAALHALPVEGFEGLGEGPWETFIDEQRRTCLERQVGWGLPPDWAEALERLLPTLPEPRLRDTPTIAPLHADLTSEHFLLQQRNGRWRVTGLIDFADAMPGDPLYEFAAPAALMTAGRPGALRALFLGYGFASEALTPELGARVAHQVLLHRFGRLNRQRTLIPTPCPDLGAWYEAMADLGPVA